MKHKADIEAKQPNVCQGQKPGTALHYDSEEELAEYEIPSFELSIACLEEKMKCDPRCRIPATEIAIRNLKKMLEDLKKHGKGK